MGRGQKKGYDWGQDKTLIGVLEKGDEEEEMNWRIIEQAEPLELGNELDVENEGEEESSICLVFGQLGRL